MFVFPFPADALNTSTRRPGYRSYSYHTHVEIRGSDVLYNSCLGEGSNGGGISMTDGGSLVMSNTTVAHTAATLYGGGVHAGPGQG